MIIWLVYHVFMSRPAPSKRVWADDFPAVALEEFVVFVGVDRAALRMILKEAAGGGLGVEKQRAGGFAAGVLPGMRDVARHERAGAEPADGDLVGDLKGDLAGEHPGDLVAVVVEMEEALGAGGQGFLEQHDALTGLTAEELQGKRTAERRRVEMLPAARGYDKAFRCGDVGLLSGLASAAASRARWLVTASRTGLGGKAAPALLKRKTLATPGVSDLSNGTSSVIFVAVSE
jgi:hypothetical protein